MVLLIPTGDDDEENDTVNLYWGRCGRVWRSLYVSTGDGVVDYRNVDLYWGRCVREWGNRSLLRTQRWGMVL